MHRTFPLPPARGTHQAEDSRRIWLVALLCTGAVGIAQALRGRDLSRARGTLLWGSVLLAGAGAQDRVRIYDNPEVVSGRVLQATNCSVIVEVKPAKAGDAPQTLTFGHVDVEDIDFAPDPTAAIEAAAILDRIKRNPSTAAQPGDGGGASPSGPRALGPFRARITSEHADDELRKASSPTVLAHIEKLVLDNDEQVKIGPPGSPMRENNDSLRIALAQALVALCWWRSEPMMLALLGSQPSNLLLAECLRALETMATRRSIPNLSACLLLDHPTIDIVPKILARLAQEGYGAEVVAATRPFLTHENGRVRYRAWLSLVGANIETASALLPVAVADKDFNVRRTVVRILGSYRNPEHGRLLLERVQRDEDAEVLRLSLIGLASGRHYFAAPELIELAETTENDKLRNDIVKLTLVGLRGDGQSYGTSWAMWTKWWEQVGSGLAAAEANRPTPAALVEMLGSDDAADRSAGIDGLTSEPAFLGNSSLFDFIEDTDEVKSVRLAAIRALTARASVGDTLRRRNPELIDNSISVMEEEKDALIKDRLRVLLHALSGNDNVDLGSNVALWRQYALLSRMTLGEQLDDLIGTILSGEPTDYPANLKLAAISTAVARGAREATDDLIDFLGRSGTAVGHQLQVLRALSTLGKSEKGELDAEVVGVLLDGLEEVNVTLKGQSLSGLRALTGSKGPEDPYDRDGWVVVLDEYEAERQKTGYRPPPKRDK